MDKKQKRRVWVGLSSVLVLGLAVWIYSRWDAWFGNPPEEPYVVSDEPQRVLLTFGTAGELSRYVTWMCGSQVDADARLLLADTLAHDTLAMAAVGEVFESRAGQAAYYRVLLEDLHAGHTYDYAVEANGYRSAWHSFTVSDPGADRFSFLYVGDVQDTLGGVANRLLRQAIELHPEVEFAAFGGDLIERPTDQYWAETFRTLDGICTSMPVLNVTGNHDYLKYLIRKCERRFSLVFPYFLPGMEQRDDENHLFAMTYHNADFFLLDSDRGMGFLRSQRQWLDEALTQSQVQHRILMLHHPLYSVKRKNNNRIARWMFDDLVQQHGVDLVLQGHEHAYTHCTASEQPLTTPDCTTPPLYVISHCSPKNYRIHPTERFYPIYNDSRYYQIVTVTADAIEVKAYDANTQQRVDSVRVCRMGD